MRAITVVCFVVLFLQITLEEGEVDSFTAEEKFCIGENLLDKNKLASILNEESNYLPEDNIEFTKFLECFWKKSGYQDENGIINYESIINLIKDFPRERFGGSYDSGKIGLQIATDAVDSCKNILLGNSHGQTAAKTQNCIVRQIEEYVEEEE